MAHLYLTIIILLATDTALSYYDVINTYSKLKKYDHVLHPSCTLQDLNQCTQQ